jgi:hypothetical protein
MILSSHNVWAKYLSGLSFSTSALLSAAFCTTAASCSYHSRITRQAGTQTCLPPLPLRTRSLPHCHLLYTQLHHGTKMCSTMKWRYDKQEWRRLSTASKTCPLIYCTHRRSSTKFLPDVNLLHTRPTHKRFLLRFFLNGVRLHMLAMLSQYNGDHSRLPHA